MESSFPAFSDSLAENTVVDLRADTLADLRATLAHTPVAGAATAPMQPAPHRVGTTTLVRTTILPRVQLKGTVPELVSKGQSRYENVKGLGEGGMGEVVLVKDNDIHRQVAMKRLKAAEGHTESLLRFVDEIQTIGQLEHPNIVPIHDVGIDEHGRYFFIMKYVQGETLEAIISKLAAGDPDTHKRFTFEVRTTLFAQVLRAVQFAHDRGFIHRDIKPANIMVGSFGEVVVMDWGLAKNLRTGKSISLHEPSSAPVVPVLEQAPAADDEDQHISTTQIGSLLGTPAYMSPEQASAAHDKVNERSDIYSLCALFYELLTLRHYLAHKTTLKGVIYGVLCEDPAPAYEVQSPHQTRTPVELWHYVMRGMAKDADKRFQSVNEMLAGLQDISEGRIKVVCPFTGMKRTGREFVRAVDRTPLLTLFSFVLVTLLALYGAGHLLWALLRLL